MGGWNQPNISEVLLHSQGKVPNCKVREELETELRVLTAGDPFPSRHVEGVIGRLGPRVVAPGLLAGGRAVCAFGTVARGNGKGDAVEVCLAFVVTDGLVRREGLDNEGRVCCCCGVCCGNESCHETERDHVLNECWGEPSGSERM